MDKIISAIVVTPSNSREKPYCRTIKCSNSEKCELYKNGQCILSSMFNGTGCPYGTATRDYGPGQRSKQSQHWIKAKKEAYKDVLFSLKYPPVRLATVGDYIYLPYSFMNGNKDVPFISHSNLVSSGSHFVHKKDFVLKTIISIVTYKPTALSGDSIREYQEKHVPLFIKHLSEQFYSFYFALITTLPQYRLTEEQLSNVGRQAVLKTLKPNVGEFKDTHGGIWTWDGEYLTSKNSQASFVLIDNFDEVKIKPADNAVVKITSDEQVTAETIFMS